jgi:hypothetical protein
VPNEVEGNAKAREKATSFMAGSLKFDQQIETKQP